MSEPLRVVEGATTPGTFEWTQADPTVLYDATDQLWKAWWSTVVYTDCAQVTTSREIHIKYAESDDGVAWRIQAEPALRSHRSADDWDFATAETPSVIRVPNAPPERRFALIFIVQPINWRDTALGKFHQYRMFVAAGETPRCPDI